MRELMYITDEKGEKEAVILPFEEYKEYTTRNGRCVTPLRKEVDSSRRTVALLTQMGSQQVVNTLPI